MISRLFWRSKHKARQEGTCILLRKNNFSYFSSLLLRAVVVGFLGAGLVITHLTAQAFTTVCNSANTICISDISKFRGSDLGGQTVDIITTGLSSSIGNPSGITVTFGTATASVASITDNGNGTEKVTITTPAHAAGDVNVIVALGGDSVVAPMAFQFTADGSIDVKPGIGSTDGGASIGSNQLLDTNGNPYTAPGYDPNTFITTMVYAELEFDRYREVEYIEFTGSQYIDTGVEYLLSDDSIRMDMDVEYTRITGNEQVTGLRSTPPSGGGSGYVWRFFLSILNGKYWATTGQSTTSYGVSIGNSSMTRNILGIEYIRSTNTGLGYLNGTSMGPPVQAATVPNQDVGPLFIGALMDNGVGNYYSEYKTYGVTIEKDGTLVRELVPAWDIISGQFGLLDKISGSFLVNSGTGTITGAQYDDAGDPVATSPLAINFSVGGDVVGTCDSITIETELSLTCVPSAWDDTFVPKPITQQAVDINIELNGDTSTAINSYIYRAPMVVDSITPNIGTVVGGQKVTIAGTNLEPSQAVNSYATVEYIEFTGAQYINTGVSYLMTDDSIKMEMDVAHTTFTSGEYLTGFRSAGGYVWRYFISALGGNFRGVTGQGGTSAGSTFRSTTTDRITLGLKYDRTNNTGSSYLNNSLVDTRAGTIPSQNVGPLAIGAAWDGSGANYYSKYKIYGFTIEKNDIVVANYIPIQNIDTGEYGLFDTVSGNFKWNSGSGAPLDGGPVTGVLANQSLEIDIDGNHCTVVLATNTAIECTLPPGIIGIKDVTINNTEEIIILENGFEYVPIIVTGVTTPKPNGIGVSNAGPLGGGNTLTITGIGFGNGGGVTPDVTVGDIVCANVVIISDTILTCDIPTLNPEHIPETVDVIISVNGNTSLPSPSITADDYIFRSPMTITSINPSQGPIEGGTQITIIGTNFLPPGHDGTLTGLSVIFDPAGTPAICTVASPSDWTNTSIICTTTAHPASIVDIEVSNGFDAATKSNGFKYAVLTLSLSAGTTNINLLAPGSEAFSKTTYGVKSTYAKYALSIRADDQNTATTDDADIKADASCPISTAKFSPISSIGGLTSNAWGWKTATSAPLPGQTDWIPMTLADQTIGSRLTPSGPSADGTAFDLYDVYFGAKSDYTQPSCIYEAQIIITATATD